MDEPMFTAGLILVGIGVWAGLVCLLIGGAVMVNTSMLMLQRYSGIGVVMGAILVVAGLVLVIYGLLKKGE